MLFFLNVFVYFTCIGHVEELMTESSTTCVICGAELDGDCYYFNLNGNRYSFCDSHAVPFKMGFGAGQLEINAKFLSILLNLPEPITKHDLKMAIMELAPLTSLNAELESPETASFGKFSVSTPREVYDHLSKTVIGQDLAKKTVSVAVINHLQSIHDEEATTHSDKHHVLMLGKSGSGKTLIANTVADMLELPYAAGDATNYSPTGFQGADSDSVISDLLMAADMKFELAERGVVFIDEIDKICCSNKNHARYESFIGSTQSTLLKMVEGRLVKIPGQLFGDMPGSAYTMSTEHILFFFGGAFNGLSELVAKQMGLKDRSMGLRHNPLDARSREIDEAVKSYEIYAQATREQLVEALIEFGMLAELAGRIPTIVPLRPLSKEELLKVLLESKTSPIAKQKSLFRSSGHEIEFTDEFLNDIVDLSYGSATGTRALDSYVKVAVSGASFDLLSLDKERKSRYRVQIGKHCIADPLQYEKTSLSLATAVALA